MSSSPRSKIFTVPNKPSKRPEVASRTPKEKEGQGYSGENAFPGQILNSFPQPILAVDQGNTICFVNYAAEQFFLQSEKTMLGKTLDAILGRDCSVLPLVDQARHSSASYADSDVTLLLRPDEERRVNVQINAVVDRPGTVLISLDPRSITAQISRQFATQNAARAASGVAAMMAHEIKNPLSGIRGAAQLIEESLPPEEMSLAQLIVKETDRIVSLVDQMEVFSDDRPLTREHQNIHHVLDHVLAVARNGFAAHVITEAAFDPSLPEINGNWNQLVQVFLNLLKNASEAAPNSGGIVRVKTSYSHGTRMRLPGETAPVDLPIEITVHDNGDGIDEQLRDSAFDPFVSSKKNGKGLGLALVAKIVNSHGGVVGYERKNAHTVFRVLLPAAIGARAT